MPLVSSVALRGDSSLAHQATFSLIPRYPFYTPRTISHRRTRRAWGAADGFPAAGPFRPGRRRGPGRPFPAGRSRFGEDDMSMKKVILGTLVLVLLGRGAAHAQSPAPGDAGPAVVPEAGPNG